MQYYSLDRKIEILKNSAEFLSYKTFPKCKIGEDLDISILKTTDLIFDGYTCGIYYSISGFEKYNINILQIWPKYHSFLPLDTIFGLGIKFLGYYGVYFFEIWNSDKVIYCLIRVLDEKKEVIKDFYKGSQEEKRFNGIVYYKVEASEINIV